ncbi:MAG TPA: helix-turn-helix transcriptional regulator [Ignavibacteria bacterium]
MSKIFEKILERIPSFKKRMTRISVDVGAQIFEYMKESGINQRQLAERLGKRESEISKWLNGSHNFTIETIAKIEDTFDKDIVLVPMFAINDLGYKYEMKILNEPFPLNWEQNNLWGVNKKDMIKYKKKNQIVSKSIDATPNYKQTGS